MKKISSIIFTILIIVIGVSLAIDSISTAPGNAQVIISNVNGEKFYHSYIMDEECLHSEELTENEIDELFYNGTLTLSTIDEAKALEYGMCPICRERNGFIHEEDSLLKQTIFNIVGIEQNSRWNNDGTWNY